MLSKNDFLSYVLADELKDLTLSELYAQAESRYRLGQLTAADLKSVATAVISVNQVFLKTDAQRYAIRQATLDDVEDLCALIAFWAGSGQNLPRSRADVVRNLQSFAVCVKDERVVGCACLYVYDSGLAEIRSLGVSPKIQRQGQGRALVRFLLQRAHQLMIARVFVLTRSPEFFAKLGFTRTVKERLPEKILKDCDNCPQKHCCDEIAFIQQVRPEPPAPGADGDGLGGGS